MVRREEGVVLPQRGLKSRHKLDLNIHLTFSRPLQCFHHISRSGSLQPSSRRVDLNPEPQTSSTRVSHSQVKRLLNLSTRKASKISQVSRGSKSSKTSDKEKSDVEVRVVPDTLLVSISPDLVSAVIVRSLFVVFEKKHQIQKKVCSWTWNQGLNIEVAVYWRGRGRGNSSTTQCHLKPFNYRHIFFFFIHSWCQSHHQHVNFIVKVHPGLVRGAIPVLSHRFSFNIYLLNTKFLEEKKVVEWVPLQIQTHQKLIIFVKKNSLLPGVLQSAWFWIA